MSKPTDPREKDLLDWLRRWLGNCMTDDDNEPCETCTETNPELSRQCCEAEDAIRRIIEERGEISIRRAYLDGYDEGYKDGMKEEEDE